jgi:lipopolysaccharide export system permease protein
MSYLGPFVMTFFIALFVLLMQFLWKYIDDLVGKGLEWHVVMRLLIFASASLVPLALPLSILLSSIMTFGNMSEKYELVACKAAGISLNKVMFPLIITSFIISICAFYFSNNILPFANLKMQSLLYDVQQQKPALAIKEGIFSNSIPGYSIRIEKKDPDGEGINGVMIYDHTQGLGNNITIVAKSGKMVMSADEKFLIATLNDGYRYEEKNERDERGIDTHPLIRTAFSEQVFRFDLSSFKLSRTNEELFKGSAKMMNIKQLQKAEDTLELSKTNRKKEVYKYLFGNYFTLRDSINSQKKDSLPQGFTKQNYLSNFPPAEQTKITDIALNQVRSLKAYMTTVNSDVELTDESIRKNKIEWHFKFTLSFACFVLFFIGAPLGAIIRKGGLGLPLVISTCLFIIFHVLTITGKKIAQQGVVSVFSGMWLASMVLLPVGIFLTYKATSDSALFDLSAYINFFKKIFRKKSQL